MDSTNNQEPKPKRRKRKWLQWPPAWSVGATITLVFFLMSFQFYQHRLLNDADLQAQNALQRIEFPLFELVDFFNLKTSDLLFNWRGPLVPEVPVALLAIDDQSVEEIGRWPWSRTVIADIIEKIFANGAKAVGMDIIFAEPERDERHQFAQELKEFNGAAKDPKLQYWLNSELNKKSPDDRLAEVLVRYHDKIVLGVFGAKASQDMAPYKDYCLSDAFQFVNGSQFVKLSPNLITDDNGDDFIDLFNNQFLQAFLQAVQQDTTKALLAERFKNKTLASLTDGERRQLQYTLNQEIYAYCDRWLTDQDPYITVPENQNLYLKIFSRFKIFAGLPFAAAVQKFKSIIPSHPIPQYRDWTINLEKLHASVDNTGSFNAEPDRDGTIRRGPVFFRTGNKTGFSFIPSLALDTYLVASGNQARINLDRDADNADQRYLKSVEIYDNAENQKLLFQLPTDRQGRMLINYYGKSNQFPRLSIRELLSDSDEAWITKGGADGVVRSEKVSKKSFLKDKIFILGATAVGIYDLRVTPFDENFPGPEVHLSAIANLLSQQFMRLEPRESKVMPWVLLVLGLALSWILHSQGAATGFAVTLISFLAIVFFDSWLFRHGEVLTIVLPAFLVMLLSLLLTFYKYWTEERKKRHLKATFSKYVSEDIVAEILKNPENEYLGGRKERLTIFFSDLRNFTSISEKLDPQSLNAFLNRYLTPMTEIIFANKGTLDKYIGDAIMAFFGAPVSNAEHPIVACRAALQSVMKLKEIQIEFAKEGLPFVDIGIGINTAEVSVGNMGSERIQSYTVIGDAVNMASRLEGLNKEYGTKILITEFTQKDLPENFVCREIDRVQVKGKKLPVAIFELLSEQPVDATTNAFLEAFKQGYTSYRARDFVAARSHFAEAKRLHPDDFASQLYIDRCEAFEQDPPPPDWNGVFVFTKK